MNESGAGSTKANINEYLVRHTTARAAQDLIYFRDILTLITKYSSMNVRYVNEDVPYEMPKQQLSSSNIEGRVSMGLSKWVQFSKLNKKDN